MPMVRKAIAHFLEEYRIPIDAGFILAVSGGADSVSMLHAFHSLNLRILVLHCNFSLRGGESDEDELFVGRFCASRGITCKIQHFDTTRYAKEKGISIEMAARELRYAWFREMKQEYGMNYIVVAHHADDVAETVFINLCRGTGIKGLTGIQPVNGDILRPLLGCSKEEILQYTTTHQLDFRTDSTNNTLDYVRNKIRHRIIPACKEINPSFLKTMEENCTVLKETEKIFRYGLQQLRQEITDKQGDEILLDITKTLASPAPYTLLYEILAPIGFNKTQIKDILDSHDSLPGKQFRAGNHILVKDRTCWRLYEDFDRPHTLRTIESGGRFDIDGHTFEITVFPRPANFEISPDPTIACLDAEIAKFPLTVRHWQTGDFFCPIGMKKNKKKISDFFTHQKMSAKQKQECLLLLSGNDIAWVIGHRIDERFKVTPSTRHILQISFSIKKRGPKTSFQTH